MESRRDFIKKSTLIGVGLVFSTQPINLLAINKGETMNNLTTKGYAAFDETGVFKKPWTFTRRPVGG